MIIRPKAPRKPSRLFHANGERPVARRLRQIAKGMLHPTPEQWRPLNYLK